MFCTILHCVILTFLKIGHDKRFCCFYWQTLQNSSFQKRVTLKRTCYCYERFAQFSTGTVILTFLKIGHDKRFCCFYWKTAANTAK